MQRGGGVPARLQADWDDVLRPTSCPQPYGSSMTAHLPATARRWLDHAIRPGTPLRGRVRLSQHGEIRLGGRWWPFTARQALDPLHGFVWPVTTRMFGLPVIGFDRLSRGSGQMRHRLLGVVTVARGAGPDFVRAAAGRAVSEMCWSPAAALDGGVRWREVSDSQVTAIVPLSGHDHEVTFTFTDSGAVHSLTVPRWASLNGGPWQVHTFGARVLEEATFGGFTVPLRVVGGYGDQEAFWQEGAFIRLTVDSAIYV